jgi:hypothetical protein
MSKRDYDSTVARIAGNIASGLASKHDPKGAGVFGSDGIKEWLEAITMLSVGLARGIVEETRRTEAKRDDAG